MIVIKKMETGAIMNSLTFNTMMGQQRELSRNYGNDVDRFISIWQAGDGVIEKLNDLGYAITENANGHGHFYLLVKDMKYFDYKYGDFETYGYVTLKNT